LGRFMLRERLEEALEGEVRSVEEKAGDAVAVPTGGEGASVLYSFIKTYDEELSVDEGERVRVREHTPIHSGFCLLS
jgi:hypothetical protein